MKQSIILLHGLFGGLSNWKDVISHFEEKFEIHAPIIPIYDEHKENILDYFVNDLAEYINRHKLQNVILVGNSLGGHVAIIYAHKYPENVNKLVLTGSSGLYENYTIGSFPRRHDYSYIQKQVANTFYDLKCVTKELVDEVFEILSDNKKCIKIIRAAKITQRSYTTDILPEIDLPVLLIWGIEDNITPPNVAEEFKLLLPNAKLVFLSECGHAPMMERPIQFNEVLDEFLKG
ncbi:MAG: alpha/beta hydrolase [Flavobacterium sp.]|nr:alpha/beta hydrolase [Flavobacterium sp.]